PDEYFEDSGIIDTLLARTGIPNRDCFYSETKKAIRQISMILRREIESPSASKAIQRIVVIQYCQNLEKIPGALKMLGIASTFRKAFPRQLLQEMVESEQISGFSETLDYLILERFLLELDDGGYLLNIPVLRSYIYNKQNPETLKRRHLCAATYSSEMGQAPDQIRHLQRADQQQKAYLLVNNKWGALEPRCTLDELLGIINGFKRECLQEDQWHMIQLLKGTILSRSGNFKDASEVFRQILQSTRNKTIKIQTYITFANACTNSDPEIALRYFEEAELHITGSEINAMYLFMSRGRFHVLHEEFEYAENYLKKALSLKASEHIEAGVLFQLAKLYKEQGNYELALQNTRKVHIFAEEKGLASLSASALDVQAQIYSDMGVLPKALRIAEQVDVLYRNARNFGDLWKLWNNLGYSYSKTGQHKEALTLLRKALVIQEKLNIQGLEKLSMNLSLATVYGHLNRKEPACIHWKLAYQSAEQLGLQEYIKNLKKIRDEIPALKDAGRSDDSQWIKITPAAQGAIAHANKNGQITTRMLVETAKISRATASKILSRLVTYGHLILNGNGRATYYTPSEQIRKKNHEAIDPYPILHGTEYVMDYVHRVGYVTSKNLSTRLGVSRPTAKRMLARLVTMDVLQTRGAGRNTQYVIKF
ncbi:tetratricopeptide repeat protein, partial [bacterium]|nr:tetratricopeptide repeat protein [bacterium]